MDQDTIASIKKKLRLATKYIDEARLEIKQLEGMGAAPKPTPKKSADGPDLSGYGTGNRTGEWFDIDDAECKTETDKALCILLPDGEEEWFPKSQISPESEVTGGGDKGTLSISEWIAQQKDLT